MGASPHLVAIPERRVVAIFDLDGTITRGDTLLPFLVHALGWPRFLLRLPLALPWLAALALRLLGRDQAKERVLRAFLGGMPRAALECRGAEFARERMPDLVRPDAMRRLAWHKERRHHCALASASLDVYVRPWAAAAGFDDVFCTSLEYAEEAATGRFQGANCRGEEKVRCLKERYGDLSRLILHGYGDSADDRPFLALCGNAAYRPFRDRPERSRALSEPAQDHPLDFLRLMRPHQWVKNAFVFLGVLFGHAWRVPELMLAAVLAAAGFSLVSSAIYIVNDYADRERDRLHPKKRERPLASGRVSGARALGFSLLLACAGGALAWAASPVVLAIVAGYAAMNIAYTFALKNVVILDVFIIAAGFLLRILAGTLGIGIPPSKWLLVCGLFLTLFLGFTKRRSELLAVSADYVTHRKALLHYNPALLDKMIGVCAAAVLMSYSLYSMSPDTMRVHGTENLVYTIPLVAYGIFRYLYLLHAKQAGADTSRDLARDPHMLVTVLAWCVATALLISGR
jgi:HAD superfamily hydrolase (TIGR01490 family)